MPSVIPLLEAMRSLMTPVCRVPIATLSTEDICYLLFGDIADTLLKLEPKPCWNAWVEPLLDNDGKFICPEEPAYILSVDVMYDETKEGEKEECMKDMGELFGMLLHIAKMGHIGSQQTKKNSTKIVTKILNRGKNNGLLSSKS